MLCEGINFLCETKLGCLFIYVKNWFTSSNCDLLNWNSEQCERMTVPSISSNLWPVSRIVDVITDSNNINKVDNQNRNQHYWLICRERSNSSPPILTALHEIAITDSKKITTTTTSTTIHIVIGPEGGWVRKLYFCSPLCYFYLFLFSCQLFYFFDSYQLT